jgi:hypothetical protein
MRTIYYNLAPTPPGFPDPIALDHWWMVSEEPFELCTNEVIQAAKGLAKKSALV